MFSAASSFGGVSSLFRGMAAPLSSAVVVNAIIFSSYGASSRLYDQYLIDDPTTSNKLQNNSSAADGSDDDDEEEDDDHDPWQKSFLCGSFAGLVQCGVVCPMEHIKCRLQVQHGVGAADNLYNGPVQAAVSIVKSHGMAGLYRGWWTTCMREVPAFGLYFSTYDYIKDNVNSLIAERDGVMDEDAATPVQHSHTWLASAFAGGVSGCLTWAVVYPVDVIKTRYVEPGTRERPGQVPLVGSVRVVKTRILTKTSLDTSASVCHQNQNSNVSPGHTCLVFRRRPSNCSKTWMVHDVPGAWDHSDSRLSSQWYHISCLRVHIGTSHWFVNLFI